MSHCLCAADAISADLYLLTEGWKGFLLSFGRAGQSLVGFCSKWNTLCVIKGSEALKSRQLEYHLLPFQNQKFNLYISLAKEQGGSQT